MSCQFQYQKCYYNERNRTAFLVVAKEKTCAWGPNKVMIVEGIAPASGVSLYAISMQFPTVDWHEISGERFEELSREYARQWDAKFQNQRVSRRQGWRAFVWGLCHPWPFHKIVKPGQLRVIEGGKK